MKEIILDVDIRDYLKNNNKKSAMYQNCKDKKLRDRECLSRIDHTI